MDLPTFGLPLRFILRSPAVNCPVAIVIDLYLALPNAFDPFSLEVFQPASRPLFWIIFSSKLLPLLPPPPASPATKRFWLWLPAPLLNAAHCLPKYCCAL